MSFALSANLNIAEITEQFRDRGFVSIPKILPNENAQRIHQSLQDHKAWNLVSTNQGVHIDIDPASLGGPNSQAATQLRDAVYAHAMSNFQYFYQNYPIYDAHKAGQNRRHVLHLFYEWIDSEEFLNFARAVTGHDDISFVDAQATRYGPGHFLAVHDDSFEGKNRRAAFVFNFTPKWRPDWGGYLQLLDDDGNVRRGLRPTFNTLNLLAVPQPHNVSLVSPFAGAARFAVTGWLRHGEP